MLATLFWWLAIQVMAFALLPLALHWLRWLPDRGYFMAKPIGILLVSYLLWLGATFGLLDNARSTILVITFLLGAFCWLRFGQGATGYLAARWRLVLGIELLFASAFVLWALVRAYDPAIAATEKPMEIAFLSATMRSLHFPPVDPWLSGYGISYYYFGYVMVGASAKLAGVEAPVAFNLAIASIFAMTAIGAFTIGHNLASSRAAGRFGAILCGAFSTLLLVVSANLEWVFEFLNARGLLSASFSRWLAIKDMPPPSAGAGWLPGDNWWWFRATRVIGDFDPITNVSRDYTINEFPFFSFMLGDLHPHLLTLPFAVLALAVSLSLLLSPDLLSLRQRPAQWIMLGLVFGALGFLNSWDLPAYLLVLCLAYGVCCYRLHRRVDKELLLAVLRFGGLALAASIVLYLPFYIGFRSQAMGLGLVGVRTKLHHLAIFWMPLLFLLVSWLILRLARVAERVDTEIGSSRVPAEVGSVAVGADVPVRPRHGADAEVSPYKTVRSAVSRRQAILFACAAVLLAALVFVGAETAALLLGLLGLSGLAVLRSLDSDSKPVQFVSVLFFGALLLVFVCEWVFIRDFFNNRMNTVFKLYFQAWLLMAVAGGYVLYFFAFRLSKGGVRLALWSIVAALLLLASFVYPVAALWSKTGSFAAQPTLDGQAFMATAQPADDEAIRWLRSNVTGTPVILEATGGSYGPAGRVSAFTGLPTVLGWDFHEQQWRGTLAEEGRRKSDIDMIYSTTDRAVAQSTLRRYGVTYVYVGPLERQLYGKFGPAALEKFGSFMQVVHRNDGVAIYRADQGR